MCFVRQGLRVCSGPALCACLSCPAVSSNLDGDRGSLSKQPRAVLSCQGGLRLSVTTACHGHGCGPELKKGPAREEHEQEGRQWQQAQEREEEEEGGERGLGGEGGGGTTMGWGDPHTVKTSIPILRWLRSLGALLRLSPGSAQMLLIYFVPGRCRCLDRCKGCLCRRRSPCAAC